MSTCLVDAYEYNIRLSCSWCSLQGLFLDVAEWACKSWHGQAVPHQVFAKNVSLVQPSHNLFRPHLERANHTKSIYTTRRTSFPRFHPVLHLPQLVRRGGVALATVSAPVMEKSRRYGDNLSRNGGDDPKLSGWRWKKEKPNATGTYLATLKPPDLVFAIS